MNELKYFIFGFLALYVIQIFDIIMNIINSYSAILVTKCQVKINELGGDIEDKYDDPHRIGFHIDSCEDEYEIDGSYID